MFNALNRFCGKVFRALNKWNTKKANITKEKSHVMFAFSGFLYLHLKGCRGLFIVKRPHLLCRFYFTTILHFAAPLTAMKAPLAGASTWPVAEVATS